MNAQRARDIAASPVMVNVVHNGVPIYIESVANDNATAYVHPLNSPNSRQKVNLTNLIEQ